MPPNRKRIAKERPADCRREDGWVPAAGEFEELAARREDDERDLGVAEDGELERLLEQAVAALGEGDLAAGRVLYPLHLRLAPHHPGRELSSNRIAAGSGRNPAPPPSPSSPDRLAAAPAAGKRRDEAEGFVIRIGAAVEAKVENGAGIWGRERGHSPKMAREGGGGREKKGRGGRGAVRGGA